MEKERGKGERGETYSSGECDGRDDLGRLGAGVYVAILVTEHGAYGTDNLIKRTVAF